MRTVRFLAVLALGLLAAQFGYTTMTVPMIAATAPALITIALLVAIWVVWPRA